MTLIELAFSQYGIKEISGQYDNPEILKYFNELGFDGSKLKDETSWCCASHSWIHKKSGYYYSKQLNARSYLDIGKIVNVPKLGDTVIFWRKSLDSWEGHVGFYINRIGDNIYVLGGNQGNEYCIKPYLASMLLGYRRISKNFDIPI